MAITTSSSINVNPKDPLLRRFRPGLSELVNKYFVVMSPHLTGRKRKGNRPRASARLIINSIHHQQAFVTQAMVNG